MENVEKCVENGNCEVNGEQYEVENIMEHDAIDNKVFDFEAHFDGNELGSGDEYDDDDRSFQIG
jgi:hypothetical protein